MDNLSKQLESTKSQKTSPSPSHSFILKKKKRTPEERSKAIYRKAVISAIESKDSRHSSSNIPGPDSNRSSPIAPSHVIPSLSIKPKNTAEDSTVQDDWRSPTQAFEETEGQATDNRVSQQTVLFSLENSPDDGDCRITIKPLEIKS